MKAGFQRASIRELSSLPLIAPRASGYKPTSSLSHQVVEDGGLGACGCSCVFCCRGLMLLAHCGGGPEYRDAAEIALPHQPRPLQLQAQHCSLQAEMPLLPAWGRGWSPRSSLPVEQRNLGLAIKGLREPNCTRWTCQGLLILLPTHAHCPMGNSYLILSHFYPRYGSPLA